MQYTHLEGFGPVCQRWQISPGCWWRTTRGGHILLLMLFLVVVLGILIWLGPTLSGYSSDPNLPWNQEHLLVKRGEQVPSPTEQQPNITVFLEFAATPIRGAPNDADLLEDSQGQLEMTISPAGRIAGNWIAEYKPTAEISYFLMGARFWGNIDPSKVYSDENGQDPSKLYFIAKGNLLIAKIKRKSKEVSGVNGYIYVTGWLDPEFTATAIITLTSDKKSFQSFLWNAEPRN